jgi:hypothetical protein
MSSPKLQGFFLYDATTGAPLAGITPTFSTYKDDTGANVAQPAITEVGGGCYSFTPVFTTDKAIFFIIDATVASEPRYVAGVLRPEDFYVDRVEDLYQEAFGKWQIHTTGGDANRLVLYKTDGVTVLQKFDLQNAAGDPISVNPYIRIPV